jgi:alginate O-acetyltransferase complex protein AlgI
MVFSSITFLFYFLPLFLAFYFLTPFKNTVLLVASLLFYAWGETTYIFILLVSIGLNFVFGLLIDNYKQSKKQSLFLAMGIGLNLVLIAYYKYFNMAMHLIPVSRIL